MYSHHSKEWKVSCISLKLPNWNKYATEIGAGSENVSTEAESKGEWTLEGFLERLIKWIVVDDQVSGFSNLHLVLTPIFFSRNELLIALSSVTYYYTVDGSSRKRTSPIAPKSPASLLRPSRPRIMP